MFHKSLVFSFVFVLSIAAGINAFAAGGTTATPAGPDAQSSDSLFSAFSAPKDQSKTVKALNEYSKEYRKKPSDFEMGNSLLPQENFEIYFMRNAQTSDVAMLRIITPANVTGCANLSQPTYEAKNEGEILWVKLGSPRVSINSTPRYTQYDCKTKTTSSAIDIPLSRTMIERGPIHKIGFRSANHTDFYNVILSNSELQLEPESQVAFHPRTMPDGSAALTHWFYPENTIVLFMPNAERGTDFSKDIRQLAFTQGLVPLNDMVEGFDAQNKAPNMIYFVDPSGNYVRNLQDRPVFFGKIDPARETHSNTLTDKKTERLDVYARTPYLPG